MQRAGSGRRLRRLACVAGAVAAMAWMGEALGMALGRPAGVPLIGRPLQLTIPLTLSAGEELPCVRADLVEGDTPPVPLGVVLQDASEGRYLVRLSSVQGVREPVVTVQLTVGCQQPYSRGYVLLAELPGDDSREMAAAAPRPPLLAEDVAPGVATHVVPHAAAEPRRAAERRRGSAAADAPRERATAAAPPAREETSAARAGAGATAPATRPRGVPTLRLEPLDVAIDQAPALKLSAELGKLSAPAMPRQEAAATWQALNAPPEQQQLRSLKSQVNDVQIAALRDQLQRQGVQVAGLESRLEQAQWERNMIGGALAAIVLLFALGVGGLLWLQARERARAGPWWQRPAAATMAGTVPGAPPPEVDSAWDGLDSELLVPPARNATREGPVTMPTRPVALSGFGDSVVRGRLPKPEELLDLRERANFFVAVGQPDKAIEMMESLLGEHFGTSPFAWLDLLDLCRELDRPEDYERVRQGFQRQFVARLPSWQETRDHSDGLERYPRALSRIELLWGTPRVLQVIEESLFEAPKAGSIAFDLDACRDLLLLYAIASEVVSAPIDPSAPAPPSQDYHPKTIAPNTEPIPLAALDAEAEDEIPILLDPDIDLSQWDLGLGDAERVAASDAKKEKL